MTAPNITADLIDDIIADVVRQMALDIYEAELKRLTKLEAEREAASSTLPQD